MICSGQITKDQALNELQLPIYDAEQLLIDKEFVLKKLDLTITEFDELMRLPAVPHTNFKTEAYSYFDKFPIFKPLKGIYELIKRK